MAHHDHDHQNVHRLKPHPVCMDWNVPFVMGASPAGRVTIHGTQLLRVHDFVFKILDLPDWSDSAVAHTEWKLSKASQIAGTLFVLRKHIDDSSPAQLYTLFRTLCEPHLLYALGSSFPFVSRPLCKFGLLVLPWVYHLRPHVCLLCRIWGRYLFLWGWCWYTSASWLKFCAWKRRDWTLLTAWFGWLWWIWFLFGRRKIRVGFRH